MKRIQILDLGWGKESDTRGVSRIIQSSVGRTCSSSSRECRQDIADVSVSELLQRNSSGRYRLGSVLTDLGVKEKEKLILSALKVASVGRTEPRKWEGTTKTAAILMTSQSRTFDTATVVKEGVCRKSFVTIILTKIAMVLVCTAVGRQLDLAAAASAL